MPVKISIDTKTLARGIYHPYQTPPPRVRPPLSTSFHFQKNSEFIFTINFTSKPLLKGFEGNLRETFEKSFPQKYRLPRIPLAELSAFGGKFGGGVSREGFKYLAEIRGISEAYSDGDLVHREVGIYQKLL